MSHGISDQDGRGTGADRVQQKLLRAAEEKLGSAKAVADFLGISPQKITDVKKGRRNLQPYEVALLAEAVGARWHEYVLPTLADQANSEKERRYWLKKAAELAKTVVLVLLIGGSQLAAEKMGNVAFAGENLANSQQNIQCAFFVWLAECLAKALDCAAP